MGVNFGKLSKCGVKPRESPAAINAGVTYIGAPADVDVCKPGKAAQLRRQTARKLDKAYCKRDVNCAHADVDACKPRMAKQT